MSSITEGKASSQKRQLLRTVWNDDDSYSVKERCYTIPAVSGKCILTEVRRGREFLLIKTEKDCYRGFGILEQNSVKC